MMRDLPELPDQLEREQSLDPLRSFIVQAPAGSGKTELLIQRYLRLLACVEQPEQILAATFTLKAAGEMRQRVIETLRLAASGIAPAEPHLRRGYDLARQVLADPARREWQLELHPSRMRIRTLDAVNGWLAGLAPLTAGRSATRELSDSPQELYREAARATLALLDDDEPDYAAPVAALLEHLDNDAARFERLLVEMLPRREQWLHHLLESPAERRATEAALGAFIDARLLVADAALPPGARDELLALLPFAAGQLAATGRDNPLAAWIGCDHWPDAAGSRALLWPGICWALLTGGGEWRQSINVSHGFGTHSRDEKARMVALIEHCSRATALLPALLYARELPPPTYTQAQWQALVAMAQTLKLAAAQLQLVFAARGTSDFAAVAEAALTALGPADTPSELGLALDYRLQHILVDEFQDTSVPQYRLLCRLTDGWEPGDGRTLFLVGDPMQSIYRFREADVGLFQQVREQGLGQCRPEFLRLRANFRSRPELVNWVNDSFGRVFPPQANSALGAVDYAPCLAVQSPAEGSGVVCHWPSAHDAAAETDAVVRIVTAHRAEHAAESLCILVRARSHAAPLMAALRSAGIAFVAPEIAELSRTPTVLDLLALTRALQHPADRLAWLGVLRSPVVGLTLVDLDALAADDHASAIPAMLRDPARRARLTDDGQARVTRLLAVLDRAESVRGRRPLREWIEGVWLALGGIETLQNEGAREAARTFLELLESHDHGGDCRDVLALSEELGRGHASLGSGQPGVTLMTMHKAKGLEFDTVILPALERAAAGSGSPLLVWQALPGQEREAALVLAPCPASDQDSDPHFRFLSDLNRSRQDYENMRLLYVAATRARSRLHLVARLVPAASDSPAERQLAAPRPGSLLSYLWPVLAEEAGAAFASLPPLPRADRKVPVWIEPALNRLPAAWQAQAWPPALPAITPETLVDNERPEFAWAGDEARLVGTIVHRALQWIAESGVPTAALSSAALTEGTRRLLRDLGLGGETAQRIKARVLSNLEAAREDPQAGWLLGNTHAEAHCEFALTLWQDGGFRQLKIDRCFVTDDGVRWIVDYKTTRHEGGALEAFLDAEAQRHRPQLLAYREAFRAMESRPTRMALYFPELKVLREISDAG